jgi:Protein of unknown function (DUF1207)
MNICLRLQMSPFALLMLLTFPQLSPASDASRFFEPFPDTKLFPLFTADGLAHQLSLSDVTENNNWIGAVGGSVPMVQLNLASEKIQASVAVTIFNRLIKSPGHLEVYTVDFKVDLPFDIRFNELALRAALGHISCHFADDALELYGQHSIQHVNDYVTLAASYDIAALHGYVYGGTNYSYGTQPIPNKPWLFQFGGSFNIYPLHEEATLYAAFDVKVKQEVGWGSTRSFQAGVRLFPRGRFALRVAYTLRMGFEDRGQFYLTRTTLNLVSGFIDF